MPIRRPKSPGSSTPSGLRFCAATRASIMSTFFRAAISAASACRRICSRGCAQPGVCARCRARFPGPSPQRAYREDESSARILRNERRAGRGASFLSAYRASRSQRPRGRALPFARRNLGVPVRRPVAFPAADRRLGSSASMKTSRSFSSIPSRADRENRSATWRSKNFATRSPRSAWCSSGRTKREMPVPDNCVNLLNHTTILQLIWLVRRARFTISVDSGPMHIAAAITDRAHFDPHLERSAQGRPL